MELQPAPIDHGIVFRRADLLGGLVDIPAHVDNIVDDRMGSTLGHPNGARVATVEHLMAALCGCGIDNVLVEINGPELPVMDGSAAPFVFLIECAGILEQAAPRRVIEVLRPVSVDGGDSSADLAPGQGFTVGLEIDFVSPAVGQQEFYVRLANGAFKTEISRSRTFGFAHEAEHLRQMGLARGASLDNAVVISGDNVMNEDGLRYEDECVRHKVLDCIGDLYLAGGQVLGHFQGSKSGHATNHQILRELLSNRSHWRYRTIDADEMAGRQLQRAYA